MDAKGIIGKAIRQARETLGLSQEKLAADSDITYQYLSALENGKENFSIGVLETIAQALNLPLPVMIAHAYTTNQTPMPVVNHAFFIKGAPLPPRMKLAHLEKALNETHAVIRHINTTLVQIAGRPLLKYIQRNNFSGIVSNILCDSLSRFSPYQYNHDQRYPDLICKAAGTGLEIKTTIRPGKGGESHNGHSGWHLVACFESNDADGDILFTHVMFADLRGCKDRRPDWDYVGSKVNRTTGSRRTETYVTNLRGTTKLRYGTVYLNAEKINITHWKTDVTISVPAFWEKIKTK
ncbi:MAG: helix-turn-helix domain-containing protein [Verrucomicrobiales bacterium]|jgi:transcriptional regulator with XRE-family HTH domain|nr:helix-turn-helix domain-containing protein [Verrucomicrobiales bacterium]